MLGPRWGLGASRFWVREVDTSSLRLHFGMHSFASGARSEVWSCTMKSLRISRRSSRGCWCHDDGQLEPDFEAVYIPAEPALKRLLGYLSFHQIDPCRSPAEQAKPKRALLQLLGPHAWNTRLTIHTQRLTDNAVPRMVFQIGESLAIAHRFSEVFQARYRRRPSAFEAQYTIRLHSSNNVLASSFLLINRFASSS